MFDSVLPLTATQLSTGLNDPSLAAGNALVEELGVSEWLGPLAPIALSPFFGLCLLSGIATYGPESLQARSALFQEASGLNSPVLFWTMLALALLSSLPRLTKVSKPLALAADSLESYSAIIILIGVRMLGGAEVSSSGAGVAVNQAAAEPLMLSAGITSVTISLMLSLFAAINILVINAVKLFFEFAIWLVPFPAVDASLELANKSLCASLLAVYAYSPTLATAINLLILVGCALVFGWTMRRLRFYREIVVGPILAWLMPKWFAQRGPMIRTFCESPVGGLPRYSVVYLRFLPGKSIQMEGGWLWRRLALTLDSCSISAERGLVARSLILTANDGKVYRFAHRCWVAADDCFESWGEANLTAEFSSI